MEEALYVGIDIGGTSIKFGLIDDSGKIVTKWEIPTVKNKSNEEFVEYIWNSVLETKRHHQIEFNNLKAIGIGSAGFVNVKEGIIYESVNIGWKDFPLGEILQKVSGLPVFVENDANMATLGELWQGKGKGEENIITITLGTGVGGGIVIKGEVVSGENGTAGEIGHIIVEPEGELCNCGRRGCLETITSATGIVKLAMRSIKENPHSQLASFLKEKGSISAKDIFNLAEQGEEKSIGIIQKVGDVLGLAIANLGVIVNPKKVLIGGGVSKAGGQLLDAIENGFDKYALKRIKDVCVIDIASLENDAGIIGGAYLAKLNSN